KDPRLDELRALAQARDSEHDRAHRLFYGLCVTFAEAGDTDGVRAAARVLLDALYPRGLTVVNFSWLGQVAAAQKLRERFDRPDVLAALSAVGEYVPKISAFAQRAVEEADELDAILTQISKLEAEKAGQTNDQALFQARNKALKFWSLFVHTAEVFYSGRSSDDNAALEALLGRWRRLLASGTSASVSGSAPVPTPPAPEPKTIEAGTPAGPAGDPGSWPFITPKPE
ncbi:MAG: hypothetical protein HY791_02225, partial [Deltaproteobacteria bacterium]|nr:hypothetical protein [Deltaproteobacteria bacterium]